MSVPGELEFNALSMVLQPIVELGSGRVIGHEALMRGPARSPWSQPAGILAAAARLGRGAELEAACRRLALEAGRRVPPEQRLFLNVDVRHVQVPLVAGPLPPPRVAIEVSEQCEVVGHRRVLEALHRWRGQGYTIVLDDYGAGHASLSTLLAVQPDMIKVDRYIVAGMVRDGRHLAALRALTRLAQDLGVEVIAEGIETRQQLEALRDLGVGLGQGWLLGRPAVEPLRGPTLTLPPAEDPIPTAAEPAAPHPPLASHYAAFFSHAGVAAYLVDRRRTILDWNREAEALSGWSAGDVVGRRCMERILDHTTLDGVPLCWGACPLVHCMAEGRPQEDTVLLRDRSGRRREVRIQAIPVRADDGRVVGAVEVFRAADRGGSGPRSARSEQH